MKQCAIVLNNINDVIKINNLKKKFSKIQNNPNMKILEECDLEDLEEKYNYWNRTINKDSESEKEEESKLKYRFKNIKTGETVTSIYPNLDNLKKIVNIEDYERMA